MTERLGYFLKDLRDAKGFTLAQAQEASGVSIAQLSRLENGLRDKPTSETLKKLASAYDASFPELMVRAGHFTKEDLLKMELPRLGEESNEEIQRKYRELEEYDKAFLAEAKAEYNKAPATNEQELLDSAVELSDEEVKERFKFKIDGRDLTEEEYKRMIAAVRAERFYKE
ncbi:MAG: helix-turn-helix transcriptional regulator [Candidatus Cohnella colombiensis]|uniref:Helix-turn-helix transcriptional regulator n=1 Tax=Candidatus Cohnella colombiensis TaxID=3121368 RepID=A0AA95EXU0_9BACL|nr:MAG: helix-turn-helix transcriptional regulator [Cohnella sp.]